MKVVGHVGEGKGGRGFRLRLGIAEFSPVQGDESAFSLYFSFFFFLFPTLFLNRSLGVVHWTCSIDGSSEGAEAEASAVERKIQVPQGRLRHR